MKNSKQFYVLGFGIIILVPFLFFLRFGSLDIIGGVLLEVLLGVAIMTFLWGNHYEKNEAKETTTKKTS